MSRPLYPLRELVDLGPVDAEPLAVVEAGFLETQEPGGSQEVIFSPGFHKRTTTYDTNVQAFRTLAKAILETIEPAQTRDRLSRSMLHLAVRQPVPKLYDWHYDDLPDAFSLSSVASTIGLRGELPFEKAEEQLLYVRSLSAVNKNEPRTGIEPKLGDAELVTFPAGNLIKMTRRAIHSQPALIEPEMIASRVLVSALFTQNFKS